MFAHGYELWRERKSSVKAANNISSDKNGALFDISLSHEYMHPLFFFSGILSLDVIWTGKGYLTGSGSPPAAPSCGWRPVSQEPLLPPPPLPVPPQGMAARLCFGNLHPPWPAGLLLAPAVSEPPIHPPIPLANSVQLLQGASATPTRHCTCHILH